LQDRALFSVIITVQKVMEIGRDKRIFLFENLLTKAITIKYKISFRNHLNKSKKVALNC
jgi:hypothetical protein